MALNLVPSPLRNFSVILRDINYVGLQESFRMRWPLASSRLRHSVTLTHKSQRGAPSTCRSGSHETYNAKSNDLFIKGAGTPNVIAMREEFVKAEHHGAGPGRLVSLSYRRKIRLSAKEAKKPEYQPLTLNNRAWRWLRLPNIEKLRPHWQAIA